MSDDGGTQFDNTKTPLVMQRFFKALKDENLMAAELWANHPEFDKRETDNVDYRRTFAKLFKDDGGMKLSWVTVEWLLAHAASLERRQPGYQFFRPDGRTGFTGNRRRARADNWRGWCTDRAWEWQRNPEKLLPDAQRMRMYASMVKLDWVSPPKMWLQQDDTRRALLQLLSPDVALMWAMEERTEYDSSLGKQRKLPIVVPMIDLLQEAYGQFDVSQVGDEMVREYRKLDDENKGRRLVLRLLKHRDTSKPMPSEFTDFIKETLTAFKVYQMLQEDVPIIKGAKTDE